MASARRRRSAHTIREVFDTLGQFESESFSGNRDVVGLQLFRLEVGDSLARELGLSHNDELLSVDESTKIGKLSTERFQAFVFWAQFHSGATRTVM